MLSSRESCHIDNRQPETKRKKSNKAKKILLIMTLCALTALVSFAVLNKLLNVEENQFRVGKTGIEVNESNVSWDRKEVWLTASDTPDSVPGVARMMLVPRVLYPGGEYGEAHLEEMKKPVNNEMVMGDITLVFINGWEEEWIYKDGYFYFKTVLEPGDSTSGLLERVSFTGNEEEYRDFEIKIDVLADIIQAEGNAAFIKWGVDIPSASERM